MPKRHNTQKDKNFDDLAHRFQRSIYGGLKGKIRLAVLERDLAEYLDGTRTRLNIVDAGGGQGQFALSFAQRGHQIAICDISGEMLKLAQQHAQRLGVDTVNFFHCPIQELAEKIDTPADLLFCHAVMEWMAKPDSALTCLNRCLKTDGILSLAFFNVNSIIYKNLLRGNYRKVLSGDYVGQDGSLTPINPLRIEDVLQWCHDCGFEVMSFSGIRVFHDYIQNPITRSRTPDEVIKMELAFSKIEPYRSLGRYIHVVARKQR